MGRLTRTGRRSARARPHARTTSATAVAGDSARSWPAPTDAASPRWSMRKLERTAAAGVSPASTSMGVRLLAASVSPVTVLVTPGPWWTVQTPTRPLSRA